MYRPETNRCFLYFDEIRTDWNIWSVTIWFEGQTLRDRTHIGHPRIYILIGARCVRERERFAFGLVTRVECLLTVSAWVERIQDMKIRRQCLSCSSCTVKGCWQLRRRHQPLTASWRYNLSLLQYWKILHFVFFECIDRLESYCYLF